MALAFSMLGALTVRLALPISLGLQGYRRCARGVHTARNPSSLIGREAIKGVPRGNLTRPAGQSGLNQAKKSGGTGYRNIHGACSRYVGPGKGA